MSIKSKVVKDVLVVRLLGRMDVNASSRIEHEIKKAMEEHLEKNVLLNLEEIDYLSSSGLRVFVSIMRVMRESGRKLALCNLTPAVQKVFEIVELIDIFNIYPSEEEALRSF